MSRRAGRLVAVGALALSAGIAGCGVPTGGPAATIPASDVPPGLVSPTASPSTPSPPVTLVEPGQVYLVAGDDTLVPRPRELTGPLPRDRLGMLIGELAAGPTPEERDQQLSTALPPGAELTVADLSGGTVTIDISGAADPPAGLAGRRAVGQIVLSATSVPGVDSVVLTLDGERVDAPLPSGELTAAPLTAGDYELLLSPAPPPSPAPPT